MVLNSHLNVFIRHILVQVSAARSEGTDTIEFSSNLYSRIFAFLILRR